MTTFIDLHVLQTVPSSNLNRDDTGSPKSATFGGVRRARVSSQAWKRATRRDFAAYLPSDDRGLRTRRIVADLIPRIMARADVDRVAAQELAVATMGQTGIKVEKPKRKKGDASEGEDLELSRYLLFLSNQQLDALAEVAVASVGGTPDKTAARAAIRQGNGIEVALFGRMVADDTALNVDASVQVAHAISTHAVDNEFDYFTAVDDAKQEDDDAGAGMIGVIEFNSSTLYRYATINLDRLMANLGDAEVTRRAVESFVRSFVVSMPTGKQNTFANGTLPDVVLAQVRDRRPVNLAGAFEDPIVAKPGVAVSVQSAAALARASRETDAAYGTVPRTALVVAPRSDAAAAIEGLADRCSLDELVIGIGAAADDALRAPA